MNVAPTESLVRGWSGDGEGLELRDAEGAAEGSGNILTGHFAVYDRWTEINSQYEGHFMERVAPGAFDDAFTNQRSRIKVLFNHGKDPSVGNKPLGMPIELKSDSKGARYAVDLFDAAYVNELKPGIKAGAYGSSFRFGVPDDGESWNMRGIAADHNPQGLPERTLTKLSLYEFGPVTFPAYADATAGLRSLTDDFVERMLNDPVFLARLVERAGLKAVEPILAQARDAVGADEGTDDDDHESRDAVGDEGPVTIDMGISIAERQAMLVRLRTR